MKKKVHPFYYDATVSCVCGETFVVGSTVAEIKVEICSKCHPYFTGRQRDMDTSGRVEKFKRKYKKVKIDSASTDTTGLRIADC